MPRMTTAEAVIETLLAHGIDTMYALPGVHNDHLFDAAFKAQDRIRVIHPRHEQTAAYMALGAALVTGKPQAFAVVPGPGILNASAALLLANAMVGFWEEHQAGNAIAALKATLAIKARVMSLAGTGLLRWMGKRNSITDPDSSG